MCDKLYVISDIHGCYHQLIQLIDKVGIDINKDPVVFLGDYIDRGPNSDRVIDYLLGLKDNVICLPGNHELMFYNFLTDTTTKNLFVLNGGDATLKAYNILYTANEHDIPKDHFKFISSILTKPYYEIDNYIFVHAGFVPGIPIQDNSLDDMLWIRDLFITSKYDWGKKIVFGHTPLKKVLFMDNKIGIDTGCVYGNKLTCLELYSNKIVSI